MLFNIVEECSLRIIEDLNTHKIVAIIRLQEDKLIFVEGVSDETKEEVKLYFEKYKIDTLAKKYFTATRVSGEREIYDNTLQKGVAKVTPDGKIIFKQDMSILKMEEIKHYINNMK